MHNNTLGSLESRVDDLIKEIPLLNNIILGPNGNLMGAYFSLKGPWSEPQALLLPKETLVTGPLSFLLETFPESIKLSLESIAEEIENQQIEREKNAEKETP